MDSQDCPRLICNLCVEVFKIPEDKVDGNLPRILLCGHIFCTKCLLSVQCDNVIRCPDCKVETALLESGVFGLQEESRIIGLSYTAKMNKTKRPKGSRKNRLSSSRDNDTDTGNMEQPADLEKIDKAVNEALIQAAENLTQLEHIHKTLTAGLTDFVKSEQARLETEIKQASDKASHAIQQWKDSQLTQLTRLETQFSPSQDAVSHVQERIGNLEIAMQMAREVRSFPMVEQDCVLDKVLETLRAPVDEKSFDVKGITLGPEMSCVFHSENLNQSLALTLKMEASSSNYLTESLLKTYQTGISNKNSQWKRAEVRNGSYISSTKNRLPSLQKQCQEGSVVTLPSSCDSSSSPRARHQINLSVQNSSSDLKGPDVIIEDLFDDGQHHVIPPTCPELASDRGKKKRRKTYTNVKITHWVVVTHVVNPSHFYIRYLAEQREAEVLSEIINQHCIGDSCQFTQADEVEIGSLIFMKWKDELWSRTRVTKVFQKGCMEPVKACPVIKMASLQMFFPDFGFTKSITIQSEDETAQSSLMSVNKYLRKVSEDVKEDLSRFVPQAIRCSLKNLVPYNLTKGWIEEAKVEFCNVVGSAAVAMQHLGQDKDSLLVDLRKAPMDQSRDVPISVREYLVFIEMARFYSPMTADVRPLLFYPPVYPKPNTEVNAVVGHINNPADFYIQLVDNMEFLLLSDKLQDFYNAPTVSEDDELRIYCPVIGQACVACHEDGSWYRAQVIGHPGDRKVEVQYVDFGDKKILSVSDLRKIKDEFFALPSKAICCHLVDVVPVDGVNWSEACTNRFISLTHQKLVTIVATEVSKTEPLPIHVFKVGLKKPKLNIAELLVKEKLASFKDGLKSKNANLSDDDLAIWDPPLELSSTAENIDVMDQPITEEQNETSLEFQPQLRLPANLKDIKVRVCYVNSPSSFYVQLADFDSHLKRVCELVKQECVLMEAQDVVWKADMYCAAHINGVWERVQICSDVTSSNTAEVRRCDHGNKVKLHVSNLQPLSPSLIGSLALECTLNAIRPTGGRSTWTDTACDLFSYYLTGASALMTIKELTDERPLPVSLFCSNKMGKFISTADFLVSEGLAFRERKPRAVVIQEVQETDVPQNPVSETQTDSKTENISSPCVLPSSFSSASSLVPSSIHPKPSRRITTSAEKVKTSLYHPPELPCFGHIRTSVSAIGEDGLIYVRTKDAEYQLEHLRERIQQSIKTLPRQKPYTWKSVQGCAVIGSDLLWYRGQLLQVLGGHVEVQYVDFGLVESIPVVHVYPMLLCADIPQLCIPCQLHGINPVGGEWQRDAVALMREVLLNRSVDLQVVELPTDPREPLTAELFLDDLSLSRILCHHEHASMDQTFSVQEGLTVMPTSPLLDDWDIDIEGLMVPEEPAFWPFFEPSLPQEGWYLPVRVRHLCTPNELFLWPVEETADLKVDEETLDEALTRINTKINSLPQLPCFPFGAPCLAEYSDGKYYRAKLIKFTSVEPVMILVQHVDFGSHDTLPPSKLRRMSAELVRFPIQAIRVKVAGFKPPSVCLTEDVLPYSPKWSVKAAMEMISLLHGNIVATVISKEPELKVELYNEKGELVHVPLVSSGLAVFD